MVWTTLARLWARLVGDSGKSPDSTSGVDASESDDDRVEGSGRVFRDPAYNGRYEAEREVDRIATAAENAERERDTEPPEHR